MGQVCSGTKAESQKAGAFEEIPSADDIQYAAEDRSSLHSQPQSSQADPVSSKEEEERLKLLRQEQARLDLIVSAAGRGMVAVRSTRGSTGYYDQGFAAALAQHLEETTQFPDKLQVRLPPAPTEGTVYERLSKQQWSGIAGEHPSRYMDSIAESILDSVVPSKQQIFAGANPMVENLL